VPDNELKTQVNKRSGKEIQIREENKDSIKEKGAAPSEELQFLKNNKPM
jgi:hypothetical protein